MTEFLLKVFAIMYILMILNPLIFYLLKQRVLFSLNLLVVILYLANWFSIIGTLGNESVWMKTWMALMYVSILFLFISISILFIKFQQDNSIKLLTVSYVIGLMALGFFEINGSLLFRDIDNFAKYGTPFLFLSILLVFIFASLLKNYNRT